MKIQEIIISKNKEPNILSGFFALFFNSIFYIFKSIFIKKGNKKSTTENNNANDDFLLVNNKYLKIKKEYELLNKDDKKLKDKFTLSVLGYTDFFELGIYKAIDLTTPSEINKCLFTHFEIKLSNSIILQRIINKGNKVTSELIEISTENGKSVILGEIDNYELYEYTESTISGGNNENHIKIKLLNK